MRSKWITMLAGVIAAVAFAGIAIGLTSPDGTVGDKRTAAPPIATTSTPTPTPTPTPSETTQPTPTPTPTPAPDADLAPLSVAKTWPGRPAAVTVDGAKVDWCPAVRTRGAQEAKRVFGAAAVRRAACTAVSFIFDKRYSRFSLPRRSYEAKDLDFVLPALAPATVNAYRLRITRFVAIPDSIDARDDLGLVVLRGEGTRAGDKHASAGSGRVFYGKPFTTTGYRNRAVWINPTWSTVSISVDRSKAEPRIVASFEASAAIPVFDTSERRDDMLTVPTHARFFVRQHSGRSWRIGGWTIDSGTYAYGRLKLR